MIPLRSHQENPIVFKNRFSRARQLLYFIACRILGSSEQADDAIASCWHTASFNPPRFEHEGEFRSWLVRIVIGEALIILNQSASL